MSTDKDHAPMVGRLTLQEWINSDRPAGEFAKEVRKTIDPKWGRDPSETIVYEVTVDCTRTSEESFTYRIEAANEEEARTEVYELAASEGRWSDVEIRSIKDLGS